MSILVTGGAGYIGSHTCVELLNSGYDVIIVDNLDNSNEKVLDRIKKITGKDIKFYKKDILDRQALTEIFEQEDIEAVIHFAGLKAVGESVEKPIQYYTNNISGTLVLLDVMRSHGVKNIIFSSSATVYGNTTIVPVKENFPLSATNPYARTKLMIEEMLKDVNISDSEWNIVILRYFNPIGAHKSGLIGEDPRGIPNNLVPYITQVAVGKREVLGVFGNDYDTRDGSGIRDYIHVVDLAAGHVKALDKIKTSPGLHIYNLGTGHGYSVFEIIKEFSEVCGKNIPYVIKPRRPGDVAVSYADSTLAQKEMGWIAERGLKEMCEDSWRWQTKNPNGYDS